LPLGDLITPPPPNGAIVRKGTEPPTESKTGTACTDRAREPRTEMWRLRIADAVGGFEESGTTRPGTVEHIFCDPRPDHQSAPPSIRCNSIREISSAFPADVPHLYEACADDVEAVHRH